MRDSLQKVYIGKSILDSFDGISLEDASNIGYIDRIDTKYLFPVSRLPEMLNNVMNDYRILEIDGLREFRYKTVYFDTPDLLFYRQHMNGKLTRYKVRLRTYKSNGLTFLEVKEKSNKGRTSKTRMRSDETDPREDDQSMAFLQELISADTSEIKPVIISSFSRITLVDTLNPERITIDFNIGWHNFRGGCHHLPFLAIAEIKSDKSSAFSPFFCCLKKMGVRRSGFSKYCAGMVFLDNVPKKNMMKQKILLINKIKNEYDRNGNS